MIYTEVKTKIAWGSCNAFSFGRVRFRPTGETLVTSHWPRKNRVHTVYEDLLYLYTRVHYFLPEWIFIVTFIYIATIIGIIYVHVVSIFYSLCAGTTGQWTMVKKFSESSCIFILMNFNLITAEKKKKNITLHRITGLFRFEFNL